MLARATIKTNLANNPLFQAVRATHPLVLLFKKLLLLVTKEKNSRNSRIFTSSSINQKMGYSASLSVKACKVNSGILYSSDFCEVKNWQYDFQNDHQASQGYNDCLCIVIVKRGNFLFDLGQESYDMHSGYIVIDKPNYEYRLRPSAGECTIFNFTETFYEQLVEDYSLKTSFFFSSPNLLSLVLKSAAETDYLHYRILKSIGKSGKLETDNLILDLATSIASLITNQSLDMSATKYTRQLHLRPIEMAKDYINEHFASDISLFHLADHCCVSPFHFTRVFKKFTRYTPHQYLQNVRLKHGETLLRNTNWQVSDIAIACGFNSVEYFATAFRQKYCVTPTLYRNQ